MSAFYDLASLVLVPSGYKASKVYAQKPLTTDGQLTFSRASTATRVNNAGLIETVSSNVPRLDYLGSTCPKLQLEPQRSNLLLQSNALGTSFTPIRVAVNSNVETSPDGTVNAEKIVADSTANATHLIFQTVTSPAGGVYTLSTFFKKSEYNFGCLRISTDSDATRFTAVVNLTTGEVTATDSFNSPASTATKVDNYGGGWYRLSVTCAHTSGNILASLTMSPTAVPTFEFSLPRFTGDNTSGVFMYGAQLELGAYSTSLITTTTAAVTRLADACSKTGITSLIGQTEGTLFIDFVLNNYDGSGFIPVLLINTPADQVYFLLEPTGQVYADFYFNSAFSARISTSTGFLVKGTRYKMALVYKQNDFAFYINGQQIGTDNSGIVRSLTSANFVYPSSGYGPSGNTINQALVFKTRLTNAQLAELTTL